MIKIEEDMKATIDIFTVIQLNIKYLKKLKKVLIQKEFLIPEKCTQEYNANFISQKTT